MKKLFFKDKTIRFFLKVFNKKYFIIKSIIKNKQFLVLVRYKAYLKLKMLIQKFYVVSVVNRCVETVNKKSFNKYTLFSRFIFLKLLKNRNIIGYQKLN